jgi:hypothetical protein
MSRPRLFILIALVVILAAISFVIFMSHTASKTTVTPNPSPSTSSSTYPAPKASATVTPGNWSTSSFQKSFKGSVPPSPLLTDVRTGAHSAEGYDRIAFDFSQPNPPGYRIEYVSHAIRDGSGEHVALTGSAILQVIFDPAQAHTDSGQPSLPSPPTSVVVTNYGQLQSYTMTGDFEGHVTFALGLASNSGYRVEEVRRGPSLWTVYIDVRR